MATDFMLRQKKLLEEIKKNNGVPPLKSLYGPVTETNKFDSGDRKPFSIRPGLATFSNDGANMKAPTDSPFLRSINEQDKPTIFVAPEVSEVKLNQLNNKTPFGDRAANNLLYSDPPKQDGNLIRDGSTGKVYTEADLPKLSGRDTSRMGGYKLDGNRIVPSGNQGDQDALRNPAPTWADAKRQWQTRQRTGQGQIASMNADKIINPPKDMSPKSPELLTAENSNMGWQARRDLNKAMLSNHQSGLNTQANNLANLKASAINNITRRMADANSNLNAQERNNILRENNTLQAQVKRSPIKRESKILKQYGPAGNIIGETLVQQDANGNWPNQQTEQPKKKMSKEAAASKLAQMRKSNDPNLAAAEAEYAKYY